MGGGGSDGAEGRNAEARFSTRAACSLALDSRSLQREQTGTKKRPPVPHSPEMDQLARALAAAGGDEPIRERGIGAIVGSEALAAPADAARRAAAAALFFIFIPRRCCCWLRSRRPGRQRRSGSRRGRRPRHGVKKKREKRKSERLKDLERPSTEKRRSSVPIYISFF